MQELIEHVFGTPEKKLRYVHLLSTLGRVIIPEGRTEWHLVSDSPIPHAAGNWMPCVPEGFTSLASFEVVKEKGLVRVNEM